MGPWNRAVGTGSFPLPGRGRPGWGLSAAGRVIPVGRGSASILSFPGRDDRFQMCLARSSSPRAMLPRPPAESRTRLAAIDIQRFESALGEVPSSRRHGAAEGGRARSDRSFVSEPARGAGHDALAAAHGRALAQGASWLGRYCRCDSTGRRAAGLSIEDDADPPASRGMRVAEGCTPCVHANEIGSTRLPIPGDLIGRRAQRVVRD